MENLNMAVNQMQKIMEKMTNEQLVTIGHEMTTDIYEKLKECDIDDQTKREIHEILHKLNIHMSILVNMRKDEKKSPK